MRVKANPPHCFSQAGEGKVFCRVLTMSLTEKINIAGGFKR